MTRQEINQQIAQTLKKTKIRYESKRGDVGYKAYKCQIIKDKEILAEGISIYAPTDHFSLSDGKRKAKFRAIQALFHKLSGKGNYIEPVRPWLAVMFNGFLCGQDNKTRDAYKGMAYEI